MFLMGDEKEERKKERNEQGQTNNKAKQHSTPKAVTFPKKNELPRVGHISCYSQLLMNSQQDHVQYMYLYSTCTCTRVFTILKVRNIHVQLIVELHVLYMHVHVHVYTYM